MTQSNFVVIQGDQPRKVEANDQGEVTSRFVKEFQIDGVDSGGSAVVLLMIKGLTGDSEPVDVHINGVSIGRLHPNTNAHPESWFTHMLHFSASEGSLNPNPKNQSEANTIEIPGSGSNPKFGKFYLQNIVCFYKPQV